MVISPIEVKIMTKFASPEELFLRLKTIMDLPDGVIQLDLHLEHGEIPQVEILKEVTIDGVPVVEDEEIKTELKLYQLVEVEE